MGGKEVVARKLFRQTTPTLTHTEYDLLELEFDAARRMRCVLRQGTVSEVRMIHHEDWHLKDPYAEYKPRDMLMSFQAEEQAVLDQANAIDTLHCKLCGKDKELKHFSRTQVAKSEGKAKKIEPTCKSCVNRNKKKKDQVPAPMKEKEEKEEKEEEEEQ
jgi:hypothetical protein